MARRKNEGPTDAVPIMKKEAGWSTPQRASGGEILPWEAGKLVVGRYLGMKKLPDRDGQQGGYLFTIEKDDDTREVYGAPTLLFNLLENLEPGATQVRVLCLGQVVETRRGQNAWDFEVSHRPSES